jgi:hypothetical protein
MTAVLHPASVVSCHSFLTHFLYFNTRSWPGKSLFKFAKVILLVDSLYAEAIEAVKAHAACPASTPQLVSTLGNIKFDARL